MGELLVVTGPPGAGKSTVARLLARRFPRSVLVGGDTFFAFVSRGWIEPWRPEAEEQNAVVLRAAAAAAGRYTEGGYTVVYDGVVGPWSLPAFAAATRLGSLSYALLLPSLDDCLARVAGRSGHGFTDAGATRSMHRQFADAGIDARHVLREPPGPPAAVAEAILTRFDRGTLRYAS